jgi:preprotein translocase subunit SecB
MDQPTDPSGVATQGATGPILSIEKIYLKDASLEVPNAPQIFLEAVQPEIEVQMNTRSAHLTDSLYESVLTITVTARAGERTVFLVEAAQAGIFQIAGFGTEELSAILGIGCPTSIFPYARETISSMVNRAGFPPINLAPISFEQLYQQQAAQAQAQPAVGGPRIEIAH